MSRYDKNYLTLAQLKLHEAQATIKRQREADEFFLGRDFEIATYRRCEEHLRIRAMSFEVTTHLLREDVEKLCAVEIEVATTKRDWVAFKVDCINEDLRNLTKHDSPYGLRFARAPLFKLKLALGRRIHWLENDPARILDLYPNILDPDYDPFVGICR